MKGVRVFKKIPMVCKNIYLRFGEGSKKRNRRKEGRKGKSPREEKKNKILRSNEKLT